MEIAYTELNLMKNLTKILLVKKYILVKGLEISNFIMIS